MTTAHTPTNHLSLSSHPPGDNPRYKPIAAPPANGPKKPFLGLLDTLENSRKGTGHPEPDNRDFPDEVSLATAASSFNDFTLV